MPFLHDEVWSQQIMGVCAEFPMGLSLFGAPPPSPPHDPLRHDAHNEAFPLIEVPLMPFAEEALKPDGSWHLPTWQGPRAHPRHLTAQQSAMSAAQLWQGLQSPAGSLAPRETPDLRCAQPSLGADCLYTCSLGFVSKSGIFRTAKAAWH